jgi:pimeloyl-ACP methyl ester carboxylesterase
MDLPGCGLTGPHPNDDYSINAYLAFLEEFTDAIGLDSFYIAGNSLGGHIVWEYAAVSSKIKKAVLVDPSGFYEADRKVPLVFRLARKKIFSSMAEYLNIKPLIGKSLREVYFDDELVTKSLIHRYFDLARRKGNRKAFILKVSHMDFSTKEELDAVEAPVLIQWGRDDIWIPLGLADIFTKHIPNNRIVIYENCGHVPQEELPETSARDAMEFLLEPIKPD